MSEQSKRNGYDFDADLMPIMQGKVVLPNFEEIEPTKALANIAAFGHGYRQYHGQVQLPKERHCWAQYFLNRTQGGALDGSGMVVWYGLNGKGAAAEFAICKHEKRAAPDAKPHIGWHPGHCVKCGLDMTVDSGD